MTAAVATTSSAARDLTITCAVDAPRSLVFKMWTDPKPMAQWWGPKGFTNPVCELDVRPGGTIRIHMRGPDGIVNPMTGEFREIVEPKRLVFTVVAEDATGNHLIESLTPSSLASTAIRRSSPCKLVRSPWSRWVLECSKKWKRAGRKAWNASRPMGAPAKVHSRSI